MKTLVDVEHHQSRPSPAPSWRVATTLRLGLIVSTVAALVAVIARAVADMPTLVIVVPVIVVAFALSWRANEP